MTSRAFAGVDRIGSVLNAVACATVFGFVLFVAPDEFRPAVIVVGVLVTIALSASRWRLSIDEAGIVLEQLVAWAVPVKRQRYELDSEINLYESLDADGPQGLCITPLRRRGDPPESECFGPYGDVPAIEQLLIQTREALQASRATLPPTPSALRCPLLAAATALLELDSAERRPSGRLRRIRSSAPISVASVEYPGGSLFELNREPFLSPSREDVLEAVQIAAPVTLPRGLVAPAGSRLSLDQEGRVTAVKGPLPAELELDGRFIDGRELIGFNARGEARSFTLARDTVFGPVTVPAGSTFHEWPEVKGLKSRWSCQLGGSTTVGGLELRAGERLHFDPQGRSVLGVDPNRDLTVEGVVLRHGYMAFPTHPDGRINLKAAKKAGLLRTP